MATLTFTKRAALVGLCVYSVTWTGGKGRAFGGHVLTHDIPCLFVASALVAAVCRVNPGGARQHPKSLA